MRKTATLLSIAIVALLIVANQGADAINPGCGAHPSPPFAGPDGRMWFGQLGDAQVGAVTTDTHDLTEYPVSASSDDIEHVTTPDGNMWLTGHSDRIFRVSPAALIDEFPLPDFDTRQPDRGITLALGPDGNVWALAKGPYPSDYRFLIVQPDGSFTLGPQEVLGELELQSNMVFAHGSFWVWAGRTRPYQLLRIQPDGTTTVAATVDHSRVGDLIVGPDGAIWSLAQRPTSEWNLIRFDAANVETRFPIPSLTGTFATPRDLIAGPDGNLWWANSLWIQRSDLTGSVTTMPWPGSASRTTDIRGIGTGNDGNIWFGTANEVGAFTSTGALVFEKRIPIDDGLPRVCDVFLPKVGNIAGGTVVTVWGRELEKTTAVWFGNARTTTFTVIDVTPIKDGFNVPYPTILDVTVPAGSVGPVKLKATSLIGTGPEGAQFIYTPLPYSIDRCKQQPIEDPTGKPILPKL